MAKQPMMDGPGKHQGQDTQLHIPGSVKNKREEGVRGDEGGERERLCYSAWCLTPLYLSLSIQFISIQFKRFIGMGNIC